MLEMKNIGDGGLFGKSMPDRKAVAEAKAAAAWFSDHVARAKKVGKFSLWATLSPALANVLIEKHMPEDSNRNLRSAHVNEIVHVITNGQWDGDSHQGIAFTTDGIVNDGQHRIHAVQQADTAVEILMTFGQSRRTFEVIDQGIIPRSSADLAKLAMLNVGSATTAAAASAILLPLLHGRAPDHPRNKPTRQDILAFLRANEKPMHAAVMLAGRVTYGIKGNTGPSSLTTAFFLIKQVGAADADIESFCELLAHGNIAEKDSAILQCREGLRNHEFSHANSRTQRGMEAASIILAWNAWRRGKRIRSAKLLKIDSLTKFPVAVK